MSESPPLRWIRQHVFKVTQDEMAVIGGVSRPRVSRYETRDRPPYEFMRRVRNEAHARGLPFTADWFFQAPAELAAPADLQTAEARP